MNNLDQKYTFSGIEQQVDNVLMDKNKSADLANSRILPKYSILSKRKGARKYNSQVIWGGKYLRGLFEYFSGTTRRIMTLAGTDLFYDNNNGVFAKAGLALTDGTNCLLSGVSYKGFAYLANNYNNLITYNGSVFGFGGVDVPVVSATTLTVVPSGVIPAGIYKYKITYVYDGYQESDGSAEKSQTIGGTVLENTCAVATNWTAGTNVTLTNVTDAGESRHNVMDLAMAAGFTAGIAAYLTPTTHSSLISMVSIRLRIKTSVNVGYDIIKIRLRNAAGTVREDLSFSEGTPDTNWHDYTFILANPASDTDIDKLEIYIADTSLNSQTIRVSHIEYFYTTGSIAFTALPVSANPRVTARKIYRTIVAGAVFYLLTEIANNTTTTYTDNTLDADLGEGNPPINGSTAPTYIKDLVLLQDRLFAISTLAGATSTILASNSGEPDIFPAAPDPDKAKIGQPFDVGQDDGDELVRIFGMEDWLYCFKKNYIYKEYIKGNPSTSWECRLLHNVGCTSYFGIAKGENDFYFYHSSGIYHIIDYNIEKISEPIRDFIKNIATSMTTKTAMCLDRTRKKLLFAFCDPYISPTTINNSVAVYDLITKEWEGIDTDLYVKSFLEKDDGTILYGDYVDGFVKKLNQYEDDENQEKIIANIDNEVTWTAGEADTVNYKDGIKGLKLSIIASNYITSATTFATAMSLAIWNNGDISNAEDFIDFWVYHTVRNNIASIELKIDVNDATLADNYAYTINVASLTSGDNAWTKIHIKKSAFTRTGSTSGKDWSTVKAVLFGLTASASGTAVVTFDDLRMVADQRKAVNTHYKTKYISPVSDSTDHHFVDLYLECRHFVDSDLKIRYNVEHGKKIKNLTVFTAKNFEIGISDKDNFRFMLRRKNDLVYVNKYSDADENIYTELRGICADDTYYYALQRNDLETEFINKLLVIRKSDLTVNLVTFAAATVSTIEGICCDENYLYVTDYAGDRVNIYSKTGLFTTADELAITATFGSTGDGDDEFDGPTGICCDETYLYIADMLNNRIKKHLKTGPYNQPTEGGSFGRAGSGTSRSYGIGNYEMKNPFGICCDHTHLWITDASNFRVMKIDKEMQDDCFVAKIGTYGTTGNDKFNVPRGIVVDDNYIYVVDGGNNNVHKREKDLLKFVELYGSSGDGNDQLNEPYDVAINDLDYIVPDRIHTKINIERVGKCISFDFQQKEVGQNMEVMAMDLSYKSMTLKGK